MKQMVDDGAVGEPRLWRGTWLSDEFLDPEIPFDWRFERRQGASTIADLGRSSHRPGSVDGRRGRVGQRPVADLYDRRGAPARTARTARSTSTRHPRPCCASTDGALGVFETAKTCARRPCDFWVEINGTRGTLRFDYARLNELWFGDSAESPATYGMRRIRAEHTSHPETEGWWPIGQGIGYGASFVNQAADLLAAVARRRSGARTCATGAGRCRRCVRPSSSRRGAALGRRVRDRRAGGLAPSSVAGWLSRGSGPRR